MADTARCKAAKRFFTLCASLEQQRRNNLRHTRKEVRQRICRQAGHGNEERETKQRREVVKKAISKARKRVRFELQTEPGSQVCVAGTFNNWDPMVNPMKDNPDRGHCAATLLLPPGRHEYKFVVNGEWIADPNCPEWVPNEQGSLNSVITV